MVESIRRCALDFINAISSDGKRYLLFVDGTWRVDSSSVPKGSAAFRAAFWGSNVDDVKRGESAELVHETSDLLAYRTSVANSDALALYDFVSNSLVGGRYIFQEPHASHQSYLHDYWRLKELLEGKYGKPHRSSAFWNSDLYKDNVGDWGMAVACGHVSFFEIWDIDDTHIELQLYGDNFEVKLSMLYQSISMKGLSEQKKKESALSGL